MPIQRIKRTITGFEAMDRAQMWIKLADGDYDEAIETAQRYERSRQRRRDVIKAINLIACREEEEQHKAAQP